MNTVLRPVQPLKKIEQIEVQIMQQSYLLSCPEGQQRMIEQAVQRLDEAMCKIRDAGKVHGRERIAVLAALNITLATMVEANQITQECERALYAPMLHLIQRLDEVLSQEI